MNMDIWVTATLNQLFIRGSIVNSKSQKNEVVSGKTPSFVIGPICTPYSI